jgi:exodeoxyribonuclease VII large subunit
LFLSYYCLMNEFDTDPSPYTPQKEVYSVSRLNSEVRSLLEGSFPLLWVEGEISNFACPSSGHWYFSLKDQKAQVRCAMFRNRNQLLRFRPENGQQVMIRARVGLYEGRGEFQLIAEHMEESGDGALRRAFEALKQKLDNEGLFDTSTKKPLPLLPKSIGIITSPTGAAIRDVLSVLKKRFPALPVIIYPVPVQGENAATEIADMIQLAEQRQECDVLLLTRGGGSLEDLWAFNEEVLARAIDQCQIPIVSAIGHEVDFTIADLVADYRAPTPSAAAEHLSPDQSEWIQALVQKTRMLQRLCQHHLHRQQQTLQHFTSRLQQLHPGTRLKQWAQRLDDMELRYQRAHQYLLEKKQYQLEKLTARLYQQSPENRLQQLQQRQQLLCQRLQGSVEAKINDSKQSLSLLSRALDTISPLATLHRGYSIIQKQDKSIVTDHKQVKNNELLTARLAAGELTLRVENKN